MIESYSTFGRAMARLEMLGAKPAPGENPPCFLGEEGGRVVRIYVDSRANGVRLYIFPTTCYRLPECFRAGWYGCACTNKPTSET